MNPTPKPRGCLRRALTALGLSLVVLWIGFFVLWLRTSPVVPIASPTLPSPNGFDDVLKGGVEILGQFKGKLPDFDLLETPVIRATVEAHKDSLALIHKGIDTPFQVPVVYDVNKLIQLVNEQAPIRTGAARMLYAEALLARSEGRPADAVRGFTDLIRLGDAMSRNVPMMPYTASLSPLYLGLIGLRDLRSELDADQLRALTTTLAALDREREPIEKVISREYAFIDKNTYDLGVWKSAVFTVGRYLITAKAQVKSQLEDYNRRSDVRLRLLLADLAVKLHFKDHGTYPANLDAITPALPNDPYSPTHRPFVYRLVEDGYQLYSVGPDGDDDKLDPPLGKRHVNTSNGDLTLDSF